MNQCINKKMNKLTKRTNESMNKLPNKSMQQ